MSGAVQGPRFGAPVMVQNENRIDELLQRLYQTTQERKARYTGRSRNIPHTAIIQCENSDENCTICLDVMGAGENVRKLLPCQHWFHVSCIDRWFRRSWTCPVCRHEFATD